MKIVEVEEASPLQVAETHPDGAAEDDVLLQTWGTPSDEVEIEYDDSYVEHEDKMKLLEFCKMQIEMNPDCQWVDDTMKTCMITWKYKKTMQALNREDYLREKAGIKEDPLNSLI